MKKNVKGIHILLSATRVNGRSAEDLAQIAVEGGASVIQLREKQMPMGELLPLAKKMRTICRDITFIINDRADLARIVEADGVHLGQDDLPLEDARKILGENSIIGISCSSTKEGMDAQNNGADYIGFGHIFPTSSKIKSTPPKSLQELGSICNNLRIPVIAIGGISIDNYLSVLKVNVGGLAILSVFSNSSDPRVIIKTMAKNFTARL
jgi:thiamine-phosphate pyrophosphorylase